MSTLNADCEPNFTPADVPRFTVSGSAAAFWKRRRKLFDEHGIDRVTMTEIISASELRTSTIYQYFSSKDDIVWAILEVVLADLTARAKVAIDGEKTALAKITALLELMADDLTRNQAKVRFLAQFDAMYARDWPAERLLTLEAQINPEGFRALQQADPGRNRRRLAPCRFGP